MQDARSDGGVEFDLVVIAVDTQLLRSLSRRRQRLDKHQIGANYLGDIDGDKWSQRAVERVVVLAGDIVVKGIVRVEGDALRHRGSLQYLDDLGRDNRDRGHDDNLFKALDER